MNIKRIIVHGGKAHLDDVFACALGMAKKAPAHKFDHACPALVDCHGPVPIERRDPTADELSDPDVLVLDVGREYEPDLSNFDHHQLPSALTYSAMKLVASHIRIPYETNKVFDLFLPTIYPWWETLIALDQHGPYETAKDHGLDWDDIQSFIGPLPAAYLRMFEDMQTPELRGAFVYESLTRLIDTKIEAYFDIKKTLVEFNVDGIPVLDFTRANPKTCEEASGPFLSNKDSGVAIFIARPRRVGETWDNTGLTLMRICDDTCVDFTKVAEDKRVKFAHKNGFLAQVASRDMDTAVRLIKKAIVR